MATRITLTPSKTYATAENAEKAAAVYGDNVRFVVMQIGERFAPVFLGEQAIQAGVHFHGHCIVG